MKPKLDDNEAFCVRCFKIKDKKNFYARKDSGRPLSYCMKCQNEVKILKLEEKLERIIEERGGICKDCKISYPTPIYEFYYENKTYNISKAKNMSIERIKKDLKDHIMLCKNCSAIRKWVGS